MTRLFIALLLSALILAVISAAPILKVPHRPVYHPTKKDSQWVYEYAPDNGTHTHTIKAVESTDKATVLTIEVAVRTDQANLKFTQKVAVETEGLYLTEESEHKRDSPDCLLKLPHIDKQKWEWVSGKRKQKNMAQAFGPERVEVPAGRYDNAIRVVRRQYDKEENGRYREEWYVPNVGLVKWSLWVLDPETDIPSETHF